MPPTSQAGRRLRHEGGELGVVGVGGHHGGHGQVGGLFVLAERAIGDPSAHGGLDGDGRSECELRA